MKLKNADVDWLLSIDKKLLPKNYINSSQNFFRSILINGNEIEFSKGFDDLHTTSYEDDYRINLLIIGEGYEKEKLKKFGIDIIHESNGVGLNLQDHLMFRPVYKVKNLKSLNRKVESLFGRFLMGLEYVLNQSGPVTMGASQVCGFVKSDPSRATPNLQFHVSPVSTDILGVTPMHDFEGITPTVANVRPTSRGEINIVSGDSRVYPKIKMNYLSTDDDRRVAAQGLKIVRKIMLETESFKKYEPEEYRPGSHITDDEELVREGSNFTQTIFHPVGTCKMGQDEMSVVDEKLKVRGISNLRVVDASIMPNITSGNTNAPTIMIAEKASDMILNN